MEQRSRKFDRDLFSKTVLQAGLLALAALPLTAAKLDFRGAVIVIPSTASVPERKAATMLAEEIEKRTQLRLKIESRTTEGPAFILGRPDQIKSIAPQLAGAPDKAEGFTLRSATEGSKPLAVATGFDDRAVVFATGYLLRQLGMGRQRLELESGLNVATSPVIPVRGHQLGYRPKTNAYDAWSVPIWDQYIRELAIFGTNTIELIPPRSDDADDSPHFPLTKIDMMAEMSRIGNEYAVDVSVWYPAMDKDYSDPKTVEFALNEWAEVYKRLPRIDVIFVPGGDPGSTQPKYLMALLEKQTGSLHRYHPKAQMWMSPQGFNQQWMEEFLAIMKTEPAWLSGIVFGPQMRMSLPELRARIPKRYPIRHYPDITHSLSSQFPVPDWDFAYSLTEGREVINPRPLAETTIFRAFRPFFQGFVTYSEGCNDDVNKFVWSGLGWNPDANVKEILTDYSRFFMGDQVADSFAQGLLALERNWKGPLLTNTGVETTVEQFRQMEATATPQLRQNWRFQEALYRANYDAFLQARLRTETEQEKHALGELEMAKTRGSLTAMTAAEQVLDADMMTRSARDLRSRTFELAEALFQSIRMQLSVTRYQAIAIGRGANLDAIDYPLNDRIWLEDRFGEIRQLKTEPERLAKLYEIVNWTNPGPGGFYDDLGNAAAQPHLVQGEGFDKDPELRHTAFIGWGNPSPPRGGRVSTYNQAETLFDEPLRLRYTDLDRAARYKVRVSYGSGRGRIRLMANGTTQIHDYVDKQTLPLVAEFEIPQEATRTGILTLEWTRPLGGGGAGGGNQVSEVWLVREGTK
jgi:hypothetical protein